MVALMRMPAGTGSEPHSHPNEQWVYVLEGTMESMVDGRHQLVKPGSLVYIPANTIHFAKATPESDVMFFYGEGYFVRPPWHQGRQVVGCTQRQPPATQYKSITLLNSLLSGGRP